MPEFIHPASGDIKSQNPEMPGQGYSQRQAHISEPDHGNLLVSLFKIPHPEHV
jgi:hypothetical protein